MHPKKGVDSFFTAFLNVEDKDRFMSHLHELLKLSVIFFIMLGHVQWCHWQSQSHPHMSPESGLSPLKIRPGQRQGHRRDRQIYSVPMAFCMSYAVMTHIWGQHRVLKRCHQVLWNMCSWPMHWWFFPWLECTDDSDEW